MSSRAGQGGKSTAVIAFAVAALGLLPACSSLKALETGRCMEEKRSYILGLIPYDLQSKYNEKCGKLLAAETIATQGSDAHMRAAGYGAMKILNEELQQSDDQLMVDLAKGSTKMQCEFVGIDPQTKQAHYRNCKPAQISVPPAPKKP